MAIHVHFNTLSKVQLFQECDKSLLFDLVTKLKPTLYLPGDYICRKVSFNEVIIHSEFDEQLQNLFSIKTYQFESNLLLLSENQELYCISKEISNVGI